MPRTTAMKCAWAVLVLVSLLGACSNADVTVCGVTSSGAPFMEPCTCDAGGIGLRGCDESGSMGPCVCEGQGAGGTGGTGGSGSGTGVGGTSTPAPSLDAGPTADGGTPPVPTDSGLDGGADAAPLPECTSALDCSTPTPHCTAGTCVECLSDGHCGANESCDTTAHVCGPECSSNADCSAPVPVCDSATQTCVECIGSSDCGGTTSFCSAGHTCVACLVHLDCPPCFPPLALAPCCSATNICSCQPFVCPP